MVDTLESTARVVICLDDDDEVVVVEARTDGSGVTERRDGPGVEGRTDGREVEDPPLRRVVQGEYRRRRRSMAVVAISDDDEGVVEDTTQTVRTYVSTGRLRRGALEEVTGGRPRESATSLESSVSPVRQPQPQQALAAASRRSGGRSASRSASLEVVSVRRVQGRPRTERNITTNATSGNRANIEPTHELSDQIRQRARQTISRRRMNGPRGPERRRRQPRSWRGPSHPSWMASDALTLFNSPLLRLMNVLSSGDLLETSDYETLVRLDERIPNNRGAQATVLQSLPTSLATARMTEEQCCICLCNYEEGETVKRLPCKPTNSTLLYNLCLSRC
uniref:RING-type domain-containing protein n=1 Tax=Compsopogon caeruleus TaxID=31354 RepID=A0A7S1T6J7_9RHOD|mmetsp:Transcript_11702/g.23823  ORF Transcript_11702/g.23823 Transcript_11702/m.23823 type:complete len:335 (+) Transcript_11702:157-1161(+)